MAAHIGSELLTELAEIQTATEHFFKFTSTVDAAWVVTLLSLRQEVDELVEGEAGHQMGHEAPESFYRGRLTATSGNRRCPSRPLRDAVVSVSLPKGQVRCRASEDNLPARS